MKAKLALREKSRTKAKQHLRRSKLLESQTDKKRILLDNIDQVSRAQNMDLTIIRPLCKK
jgi:hypothetical protein